VAILRVHAAPINILYYMYLNTGTIYRLNFSEVSTTPTNSTTTTNSTNSTTNKENE